MRNRRRKLTKDKRNGQYYVRIQVGGVRRYFPLGTSRKKAELELTRLERLHASGELDFQAALEETRPEQLEVNQAGDEITLKELTDVHLEWVAVNRAPSTYELRERYLLAFLRYSGDKPVSEIGKLTLAGFHGWAKEHHSKSKNGGNIFLRNVKSMFLWGEDMDICRCPVRKFPYMPEMPPETKRFTDEELSLLLDCIKRMSPDFHDMVVFALLTGLRPPELRELQRCHFKNDNPGAEYLEFQQHKTAKSSREPAKRTIPLVPEAVEIINRQIGKHAWRLHVFLNEEGKPYTSRVFRQRLKRWCERAGIKPRPPYALRHTFGSAEAEADVNQAVLAQIMGHTQLRTTARYVNHNAEHHRKAVGAISGRICRIANPPIAAQSGGNKATDSEEGQRS
ncbi:tyrosine-type recombinase/integrase [Verrucomicrobiota bacterium]